MRIALWRLKKAFIPITQILQCRAVKQKVLFISEDTLLAHCTDFVLSGHMTPTSYVPGQLVAAHPEAQQALHMHACSA